MVGPQMVGSYRDLLGPYGPIWARMGPRGPGPARANTVRETISENYIFFGKNVFLKQEMLFCFNFSRSSEARAGPIWAHTGPYGPSWAHMDPKNNKNT